MLENGWIFNKIKSSYSTADGLSSVKRQVAVRSYLVSGISAH